MQVNKFHPSRFSQKVLIIFGADERLTYNRCVRFGKIRLLCIQIIQELVNLKYPFEHYYLENIRIRSHFTSRYLPEQYRLSSLYFC